MLHFMASYMKKNKSCKQTLERAQNRPEIILKKTIKKKTENRACYQLQGVKSHEQTSCDCTLTKRRFVWVHILATWS